MFLAMCISVLFQENITVLIEPLNTTRSVPGYFLVHNKQGKLYTFDNELTKTFFSNSETHFSEFFKQVFGENLCVD